MDQRNKKWQCKLSYILIWKLDFFSFNSQIIKRLLYLALSVEMDLGRSVKLLAVRWMSHTVWVLFGWFWFFSVCFCFVLLIFFFHMHSKQRSMYLDAVFLQLPHWERRASEPFLCPTHFVVLPRSAFWNNYNLFNHT